jgi:hypothetical protein
LVVRYSGLAIFDGLVYELGDSRWLGIRVWWSFVVWYTGMAMRWDSETSFGSTRVFDIGHGEKEEWLAMVLEVQRVLYVIETTVFARLIASSK